MHTPNIADKNYEALSKLFPNAVTETITGYDDDGKAIIERAIDADVLRQEISCKVVEGKEERYQFTWPDKRKTILNANAPITKTLRPVVNNESVPTGEDSDGNPYCSSGSVDFDNTENLYIEGDNIEVLKLLQETYLGKIKMIYIDPPYNTGNDFVYKDDFAENVDDYIERSGRFHTDWLNMIYPRLKLARELLSEDGVIFISIDDNEQENLKKVCDEIFGGFNFVAELIWERAYSPKNDAKYISNSHDYVLMYSKQIDKFKIGRLPRTEAANARYSNPDNDPRGIWKPSDMSVKTYNAECDYSITTPSGRVVEPPTGRCWSLSKNAFLERLQDNRIYFGADGNSVPCIKRFLTELKYDGMAPTSILFYKEVGHSQEGAKEVTKILEAGAFDGPKPIRLMKRLLTLSNLNDNDIVLDFFSGSASTAHAVMQLNAEDGGNRKFIMVQLPEMTDKKSEAYKAGYKNICEIGKERIRRAGAKIKEENPQATQDLDVGFRVLKLDSSNMKDVYYKSSDTKQMSLTHYTDNIKDDRTPEDLLFQVMLDLGILLSSKIEEVKIAGKKVFKVEGNYLIACFESDVTMETVKAIAYEKPYYVVFRDCSMVNDSVANNFDQIFNSISPNTIRKVM
jgi:adenine-specific DNA-methyltransferase